jgi:hypothetical protein
MIIFGQNKSLLQANKLKFLALEQQKKKKKLKSVFISPDMFLRSQHGTTVPGKRSGLKALVTSTRLIEII